MSFLTSGTSMHDLERVMIKPDDMTGIIMHSRHKLEYCFRKVGLSLVYICTRRAGLINQGKQRKSHPITNPRNVNHTPTTSK